MDLNKYLPSMSNMPYLIRDAVDKVTNAVMNYTPSEIKVVKATNDDSWGPHNKLMAEIAELTFSPYYGEVMTMLWRRTLREGRDNWRRTYKGCTVLIYLLKHGSHRVIHSIQDRTDELRFLADVNYPLENGRDVGRNVRTKVNELIELVENSERLEEERLKAKELKSKYVGMSSESTSYNNYKSRSSGTFEIGINPFASSMRSSTTTSMDCSELSGRWRSTNPGFLEKITDIGERMKDFVQESKNSFTNGSRDDVRSDYDVSSDEDYRHNSKGTPSNQNAVNPPMKAAISQNVHSPTLRNQTQDNSTGRQLVRKYEQENEDFTDFQQADIGNFVEFQEFQDSFRNSHQDGSKTASVVLVDFETDLFGIEKGIGDRSEGGIDPLSFMRTTSPDQDRDHQIQHHKEPVQNFDLFALLEDNKCSSEQTDLLKLDLTVLDNKGNDAGAHDQFDLFSIQFKNQPEKSLQTLTNKISSKTTGAADNIENPDFDQFLFGSADDYKNNGKNSQIILSTDKKRNALSLTTKASLVNSNVIRQNSKDFEVSSRTSNVWADCIDKVNIDLDFIGSNPVSRKKLSMSEMLSKREGNTG